MLPVKTCENVTIDVAISWLLQKLTEGPQSSTDMFIEAVQHNISEGTLKRAKAKLNVLSKQEGSKWFWSLPGAQESHQGRSSP
jgi:hypothetical protein